MKDIKVVFLPWIMLPQLPLRSAIMPGLLRCAGPLPTPEDEGYWTGEGAGVIPQCGVVGRAWGVEPAWPC